MSGGPSDLHLHVAPAERCAGCGEFCCVCWPMPPSPAQPETVAEAVTVLRELSDALGRTAPIVDEVPFTLRREARKDDGAKPGRLPW